MALWKRTSDRSPEIAAVETLDRLGAHQHPAPKRNRVLSITHGFVLFFFGAIVLALAGAYGGRTMIEKTLTALLMPVGFVWLALIVIVYACCLTRQIRLGWVAVFGWLILTVAGNALFSNWLISTLERPYQDVDVFQMEPLDTVVVLGGGTATRLNGVAQAGEAGDRVVLAARLYHAGLASHFICTGTQAFRASELDLDPRAEAAQILIGLGVPPGNVTQLHGHNTFEEMQNLKVQLEQDEPNRRTGLLTSAWHLPRAMRLAESNGLNLIPVPSDFLTSSVTPSPNWIVPGAFELNVTGKAVKEYLAGWVGR